MSHEWTNAMWAAAIAPAGRKLVAIAVADCHNASADRCDPGVAWIAAKTTMSEGQVRRHLTDLCEGGWLTRDRVRRPDGSLSGYVYALGPMCMDAPTSAHARADHRAPTRTDQRAPMRAQEEPEVSEPEGEPVEATRALVHMPAPLTMALATTDPFDDFWSVYPRKAGKDAARRAWAKAIRRAAPEVIIRGAAAYRADPNREDAYTAHAATWLNAGRWDDDPLPSKRGTKDSPMAQVARVRDMMGGGAR